MLVLCPKFNVTVCPGGEEPGLEGMPLQGHNAEIVVGSVPGQLLHGHDERVLQEVGVHHAVAHRDVLIVAGRGEERIPLVELDRSHRIGVVAQDLVGHAGQVQVEPLNLLVEGAQQQVVTARVHCHRGNPFSARH